MIQEINRVSKDKAIFLGSVPVPERNRLNSTIRGQLFPESKIKAFFEKRGWSFSPLLVENGCLLYFKAMKIRE